MVYLRKQLWFTCLHKSLSLLQLPAFCHCLNFQCVLKSHFRSSYGLLKEAAVVYLLMQEPVIVTTIPAFCSYWHGLAAGGKPPIPSLWNIQLTLSSKDSGIRKSILDVEACKDATGV